VQLTCPPRATSSSSCRRRKSPWRKRYVVLYTVCTWLSDSKRGINVVLLWSFVSSSGWVSDRNQECLENGNIPSMIGWVKILADYLSSHIVYLSIVCKCFITWITAWNSLALRIVSGLFHFYAHGMPMLMFSCLGWWRLSQTPKPMALVASCKTVRPLPHLFWTYWAIVCPEAIWAVL
jgi:hypothetical protein